MNTNKKIVTILLLYQLLIFFQNVFAQETLNEIERRKQFLTNNELPLKLPDALKLAHEYILINKIDVSEHYLDNIRFVYSSAWMKGRQWIVTWKLKILSDGGEIIILIDMDKKIKIFLGR
ncbi:MAG: hypothetical protein GY714_25365 [Desulfobacterales bacterium]|nr:hypothetical protein [Desulfobacterales bacterium]MCP4161663.1 hypothetical protein [Deltaproteobacteria bacterium]